MKRAKPDPYAQAVRDLEPLTQLREFHEMADHFDDEELAALIEVEYSRWGDTQHPEDEPYFRRIAAVAVGYRLAMQVMHRLLAGGAR